MKFMMIKAVWTSCRRIFMNFIEYVYRLCKYLFYLHKRYLVEYYINI